MFPIYKKYVTWENAVVFSSVFVDRITMYAFFVFCSQFLDSFLEKILCISLCFIFFNVKGNSSFSNRIESLLEIFVCDL